MLQFACIHSFRLGYLISLAHQSPCAVSKTKLSGYGLGEIPTEAS